MILTNLDRDAYTRLTIHAGSLHRRYFGEQTFKMVEHFFKDATQDFNRHDIVLIKVHRDIEFNANVNVIKIPVDDTLKDGDIVTAAGWGWTSVVDGYL